MRRLIELALFAVVAFLLLSRCNTPMVGEQAPALQGGPWVGAEQVALPTEPEAGWRLLAFFNPG